VHLFLLRDRILPFLDNYQNDVPVQVQSIEPCIEIAYVAVDVLRRAFCKAAASAGLSCLTMGAIERS
jgi:hypothetical protein